MTTPVLRRWLQCLLAVAASVILMAGLGACGAGRGVLGTKDGPCFIALPVARRAVEGRGTLAGIRLVDISALTGRARALRNLLHALPVQPPPDVCLIAYTGSFTPGQVELPGPYPPGPARLAIAVVTTTKPKLLGTMLVQRVPLNFFRAHVDY